MKIFYLSKGFFIFGVLFSFHPFPCTVGMFRRNVEVKERRGDPQFFHNVDISFHDYFQDQGKLKWTGPTSAVCYKRRPNDGEFISMQVTKKNKKLMLETNCKKIRARFLVCTYMMEGPESTKYTSYFVEGPSKAVYEVALSVSRECNARYTYMVHSKLNPTDHESTKREPNFNFISDTERLFYNYYEERGILPWRRPTSTTCYALNPVEFIFASHDIKIVEITLDTINCEKIKAQILICTYEIETTYMKDVSADDELEHFRVVHRFVRASNEQIYEIEVPKRGRCDYGTSFVIQKRVNMNDEPRQAQSSSIFKKEEVEELMYVHVQEHGPLEWTGLKSVICHLMRPGELLSMKIEVKTEMVMLESQNCHKVKVQLLICIYRLVDIFQRYGPEGNESRTKYFFARSPNGDVLEMALSKSEKCPDRKSYALKMKQSRLNADIQSA